MSHGRRHVQGRALDEIEFDDAEEDVGEDEGSPSDSDAAAAAAAGDDVLLSSDELDDKLGLAGGTKPTPYKPPAPRHGDQQKSSSKRRRGDTDKTSAGATRGGHCNDDGGPGGACSKEGGTPPRKKVLSTSTLLDINAKAQRRGVVYISRIPPHMKPGKIRQLLSVHGEIGRLYCAPEDKSARRDRKKTGKDTGKNFTEGWVEFEEKKVAKRVAAQLNGSQIGGKHRSKYYYDLWCLKYLPKFRWDHLTEEINYQRAVREQRLAAEISAAKRERDFYLASVNRAKAVDAIRERKAAKAANRSGEHGAVAAGQQQAPPQRGRQFKQVRARPDVLDDGAAAMDDDVLAMVGAGGRR